MTIESATGLMAELLDRAEVCTLEELCHACKADANWIAELVEHGVIEPIGDAGMPWRFEGLTIVRVAKAQRLERDLGLNTAGIAMVLDLIEEIEGLRARLEAFEGPAGADANSST